ncbi:hypothetical protein [Corynebacterium glutamicum]|uniref:Uncharacterized protein n=2 Tax=Corynebacterium glutamicum TaxID=1718 RepID=Q5KRI2_CORGT|nr:hypothetical protein [Corynebacterium glutamicum]BAD84071.1 hypothetical protein [Corynebacterium glutamicum]BAF54863.1 hypothetical protein cgR_1868 [Corynebacterium glutamicum R]
MDPHIAPEAIQLRNIPWPNTPGEKIIFKKGTTAEVKDGYLHTYFPCGGDMISGPDAKVITPNGDEVFVVPILLQALEDQNIPITFL